MSWEGRQVLVTGAGGFIGSHLVKRLLAEGARVHILIRKSTSLRRLQDSLNQLTIWEADITDRDALQATVPRIQPHIVFHLAALVDVSRSWELITPLAQTNILGTIHLVSAVKDSPLEAFIQTSSSEEYGDAVSPLEETQRESPISPYSFSKVASTHFCQMVARTFDVPIATVRLFPTYGPFQDSSMFIPSAIRTLFLNRTFKMSPGDQLRDFNYVDDIVEAYLRVAQCPDARGELLNVGSGAAYKLKDVIETIRRLLGGDTTVEVGALPYRKGEGSKIFCDNRKIQQLTGWSPKISLEEGLRLTVDWYKSTGSHLNY